MLTCGLILVIFSLAESIFFFEMSFVLWRICRCKFVRSTVSLSQMVIEPIPEETRYRIKEEAVPPAPMTNTELDLIFFLPFYSYLI